jgi:O-antigen/teichoic acid export membrane protein
MRLSRSAGVVSLSWGLIDQGFSSATNLGLTVIAGRSAGPGGLGVVYLGFSAYLVALTMQRALVSDPLIVSSAPYTSEIRANAARKALTVVISAAALSTLLLLLLGLVLPASLGEGLLLFVPWLIGALVQDFWRALLFRDGRGGAAALNDGVWAAVMAVCIPLLLVVHSQWMVVLTWGAGALAGGLLGFLQTRVRPAGLTASIRWWKAEAWPLARWLGPESALLVVQAQVVVFALVAILGTADVGGLRAVQAVFAPMSLLAQAISLPGLPMLATMAVTMPRLARVWALRLSAIGVALVLAYLVVLAILPRHIIGSVFGSAFDRFDSLIVPTGVAQVLGAAALGMGLLLKAESRVRALLMSRVMAAAATVVLGVLLATADGIIGATWGIAVGTAVGFVSGALLALWFRDRPVDALNGAGR